VNKLATLAYKKLANLDVNPKEAVDKMYQINLSKLYKTMKGIAPFAALAAGAGTLGYQLAKPTTAGYGLENQPLPYI
jgi:hypothetical protein